MSPARTGGSSNSSSLLRNEGARRNRLRLAQLHWELAHLVSRRHHHRAERSEERSADSADNDDSDEVERLVYDAALEDHVCADAADDGEDLANPRPRTRPRNWRSRRSTAPRRSCTARSNRTSRRIPSRRSRPVSAFEVSCVPSCVVRHERVTSERTEQPLQMPFYPIIGRHGTALTGRNFAYRARTGLRRCR